MTDYSELKNLLEACLAENCNGAREFRNACDALFDVCTIETIAGLVAENERLQGCEDVLRQLASFVGAGGYNAPEVDPEVFARKILDGINILNDPLARLVIKKGEQIDQLRAENAGLKTGYEAYERVNAELRKDAERYRRMRAATLKQLDETSDEFDEEFDSQLNAVMSKGEPKGQMPEQWEAV